MEENFKEPKNWYASKDDPAVREFLDRVEREMAARTKAKIAVIERIPATFVEAMKEVSELIQCADSSTTTESDDLIQVYRDHPYCPVVTGGLYDSDKQRFGFSTFEGDHGAGENVDEYGAIEWCYDLSPSEIEGIANGKIVEREMFRCEPDCGRRWACSDAYCGRCDGA